MNEIEIPEYLPPWIKEHIELYLRDGDAGHLWDASRGGGKGKLTTLLLQTTGRKSGRQLVIPLIYQPVKQQTGDSMYCVIASKGGAPAHPAWYLNLLSNPRVRVKVANEEFEAIAQTIEGPERNRLWDLMADYFSPYAAYQAATERQIPVVVLQRQ